MGRQASTRSPSASTAFNLSTRSTAGGRLNSRSKTSARERYPRGNGGPNDIFRWGRCPWVNANGSSERRNARSHERIRSRCEVKRIVLPFSNRMRKRVLEATPLAAGARRGRRPYAGSGTAARARARSSGGCGVLTHGRWGHSGVPPKMRWPATGARELIVVRW